MWILPPIEHRFLLRWLPRVFSNNPSYLAYDTEGNLVTLSLRFGSRNSPLSLPMQKGSFIEFNFIFWIKAGAMATSHPYTGSNFVFFDHFFLIFLIFLGEMSLKFAT